MPRHLPAVAAMAVLLSGCLTVPRTAPAVDAPITGMSGPAAPSAPGAPQDAVAGLDLVDVSPLVDASLAGVVAVTQDRFVRDFAGNPYEIPAGAGTGIVIDDEGHVLTNAHVVEGAQRLLVTAADGRDREATLVGVAPHRDLALLRVADTAGLSPLPLGDSSALEVGDPVIAIGNALALDATTPTVSAGILSAKERTIRTPAGLLHHMLQTDAAINPGNSGGPLLDAGARVVGINTAVAGGAQGIGFAIAIDAAKPTVDRFLRGVGEPWLGVAMVPNSAVAAQRLGLAVADGALVTDVAAGSPAAAAGIQRFDVLVAVAGEPVGDTLDVLDVLNRHDPGDDVLVEVVRDGDRLTLPIRLGELPLRP